MSNAQVPSTTDSWSTRIEQFSKVVGKSIEEVEAILSAKPYELTKDTPYVLEMLSDEETTPFGDFRKMFCDDCGVSLPKLRMGMKFLRGTKEQRQTATSKIDTDMLELQTKYGIKTNLEDLDTSELLKYYSPNNKNKIFEILKERFGVKPVIAFKPDTTEIAMEETLEYITDIQDGLPEEKHIQVNGELVQLYAIGEYPKENVEEDPMFPGYPLKRGRSTVNRINWSSIDQKTRQLVRVIINNGEVNPNDRMAARSLFSLAQKGTESLKETFPESYMKFKKMMKNDELPKLSISMDSVKVNNPFGINRKY